MSHRGIILSKDGTCGRNIRQLTMSISSMRSGLMGFCARGPSDQMLEKVSPAGFLLLRCQVRVGLMGILGPKEFRV